MIKTDKNFHIAYAMTSNDALSEFYSFLNNKVLLNCEKAGYRNPTKPNNFHPPAK